VTMIAVSDASEAASVAGTRLIAFVVPGLGPDSRSSEDAADTASQSVAVRVTVAAARALRPHFVPNAVIEIDRFPRTATGKVDRRALANTFYSRAAAHTVNHVTMIAGDESLMSAAEFSALGALSWAQARSDAWFKRTINDILAAKFGTIAERCSLLDGPLALKDIGGDSLMAVELAWRCEKEIKRLRDKSLHLQGVSSPDEAGLKDFGAPTAVDMLDRPLADLSSLMAEAVIRNPCATDLGASASQAPVDSGSIVADSKISFDRLSAAEPAHLGSLASWRSRGNLFGGRAFGIDNAPATEATLASSASSPAGSSIRLRWRVNLGRCVDASALVVATYSATSQAALFIGAHSRIVAAIDSASGGERWRREVMQPGAPRVGDDASIEATAAVTVISIKPRFFILCS